MSDRHDDPAVPGGAGAGPGERAGHDLPPPTGFLRGVGVVVVAVVIGVLVMPSATRAPLRVFTAAQSTPTTTSPPTTTVGTTTTTTATIVVGAASIHVLVANGTSITGLAGGTDTYLRTRGFAVLTATNATTKVTATQLYAVSGPVRSATTVASALGLPSSSVEPASAIAPVPSTAGATVVVIAGPDLSRLAPSGTTTSPTGTSTH